MMDTTYITGEEYARFCAIHIDNALGKAPSFDLASERILKLPDRVISLGGAPGITVEYDPLVEIPMLDVATRVPTGATMTHEQIHAALFSVCMFYRQQQLDAAAELITPPVIEPPPEEIPVE